MAAQEPPLSSFSLLLQVPDAAKEAVICDLDWDSHKQLRLTCKAMRAAADASVTCARFSLGASPLQPARFPRMTPLMFDVLPDDEYEEEQADLASIRQAALELDFAACMPPDAWPHVTVLLLNGLTEADTQCVIARCPHVTELAVFSVAVPGSGDGDHVPPRPRVQHTICRACASLPWLASFYGPGNELGDEELQALAACPSLVSLTACLVASVSQLGWPALATMTQLQSLDLSSSPADLYVPNCWDLSSFSALTRLSLHCHVAAGSADVCDGLHVPDNLVQLNIQGLPQQPLPVLSHLTALSLSAELDGSVLARLAASCPALTRMTLGEVSFFQACNLSPLQQLTRLEVNGLCTAAAGARLSLAFPALHVLHIIDQCRFEPAGTLFLGATALQQLDVARAHQAEWPDLGLSMDPAYFQVLAQLPHLHTLRMNTEPDHVQGLCHLPNLRRLGLVFTAHWDDNAYDDLIGLYGCLPDCTPPPSLEHAYLELSQCL